MKNIWKMGLVVLVAFLVSGCDTGDTGDNVLTGDEPVLCTGEESDDLNCVPDESADADTYVGDDIWESPDSEINPPKDSESEEECVPTIPEGAKVKCEAWCCVYTIQWDMEACTASGLKSNGEAVFWNVPPDLLISADEHTDFYCTIIDE